MLQCPRCSNPLIVGRCACSGCISPTVSRMQVMGGDVTSGGVLQYPHPPHPSSQVPSIPGVIAYPSSSPLAYPSPSPLAYPSPSPLAYPPPNPLSYPSSTPLAYPPPINLAYPPSPSPMTYPSSTPLAYPPRSPTTYPSSPSLAYPPLPPLFVRYQNLPGAGPTAPSPSRPPSVPVSPRPRPHPGPAAVSPPPPLPPARPDADVNQSSEDGDTDMLYGSGVMPMASLEPTSFIQQQAQIQQQLELLKLQTSVLQNQLQQSKLQQQVEQLHRQQHSLHPLKNAPPDPLPLLTSTVASTTPAGGQCSFSQPATPAIMVGAMSPFFQSPAPHLTFTVSGTLPSWTTPISSHLPLFTPPPEIPMPRAVPDDREVLKRARSQLEETGWYHHALSWQESSMMLQDTPEGTFLVRDSQDPRFLYSLSVQRAKEGPTSVRIHFSAGKFRLDAEERIRELMPKFDSVGELVEYYVTSSRKTTNSNKEVFVDNNDIATKVHSPIVLRWPLYRRPPSLRHLSRLVINNRLKVSGKWEAKKTTGKMDSLELPAKLLEYINSYQLAI